MYLRIGTDLLVNLGAGPQAIEFEKSHDGKLAHLIFVYPGSSEGDSGERTYLGIAAETAWEHLLQSGKVIQ